MEDPRLEVWAETICVVEGGLQNHDRLTAGSPVECQQGTDTVEPDIDAPVSAVPFHRRLRGTDRPLGALRLANEGCGMCKLDADFSFQSVLPGSQGAVQGCFEPVHTRGRVRVTEKFS